MQNSIIERQVPDDLKDQEVTCSETYKVHIERYQFANQVIGNNGAIGDIYVRSSKRS